MKGVEVSLTSTFESSEYACPKTDDFSLPITMSGPKFHGTRFLPIPALSSKWWTESCFNILTRHTSNIRFSNSGSVLSEHISNS